jgi:Na+-transporting NADH:ubiquinone oxidoreductase subunit NqrE
MSRRLHSYTAYSVACALVWALILVVVAAVADTKKVAHVPAGLRGLGHRLDIGHDRPPRLPATVIAARLT